MSELRVALDEYLTIRRRLGFALDRAGRLLPGFIGYLEAAGADHITTDLAVAWATSPADAHPHWWRQRLGLVRGFARHVHAVDCRNEVPPEDVLRAHRPRVRPYLYSDADLGRLMAATRALSPAFRAATYEVLIGLLAVTGLRLGEALGLDRGDVDLAGGFLVVRRAKFDKPREVVLHETTMEVLAAHSRLLDERFPAPGTAAFFVSARGDRLTSSAVHYTFPKLVRHACLEDRGERCRPRPHDLRHSLAVGVLLGWYQDGVDVDARLPLLSTYLGHVKPASTYWYLQATPELLAIAGQRLDGILGELR